MANFLNTMYSNPFDDDVPLSNLLDDNGTSGEGGGSYGGIRFAEVAEESRSIYADLKDMCDISPEYFDLKYKYAITLTYKPELQMRSFDKIIKDLSELICSFLRPKRTKCKIALTSELTLHSVIHHHGVICSDSKLQIYELTRQFRKKLGFIVLKPIFKMDTWIDYISKDEIGEMLVFEHSRPLKTIFC